MSPRDPTRGSYPGAIKECPVIRVVGFGLLYFVSKVSFAFQSDSIRQREWQLFPFQPKVQVVGHNGTGRGGGLLVELGQFIDRLLISCISIISVRR